MNYSLTMREKDLETLREEVFSKQGFEGAAYLLCGESQNDDEVRLLVREIIPIENSHYQVRQPDFLSISSESYVPVAKKARQNKYAIIFVHSHPGGFLEYSKQDDHEEMNLQEFFQTRVPNHIHGSLILTETGIIGRVFNKGFQNLNRIRILGSRFSFHDHATDQIQALENLHFFDRQVRAFGPDIQMLLQRLHIGVVGAGGTGSAVIEQLVRFGVGKISIFDQDVFDSSNINRLYGSSILDVGNPKVEIAKNNIERIGLGTKVHIFPENITKEDIALHLRSCDLIFGCTDKQRPRAILVQIALRYLIPVFDMGVVIQSNAGTITDVIGRVTFLFPGEACLFCRKRITPRIMQLEGLSTIERAKLAKEGYAPELDVTNPAVVAFTTSVASVAISELLHRLTGFMGKERTSSEVLYLFDQTRLRSNRTKPAEECICSNREIWGRGDSIPFLDLAWST